MSKTTDRVREIIKSSQNYINPRAKTTPTHILKGFGDIHACIALLSSEIEDIQETLEEMRAEPELIERDPEEVERLTERLNKLRASIMDDNKKKAEDDWKMLDPGWKEPVDEPGE